MIIFVVVGRLGKSLTLSKVAPFLATGKISKVFVFRQEAGFPLKGVEYITLPGWVTKLRPVIAKRILRFIYEPLQLIWYSIKLKPKLINGVFTLPKGLNSVIVGKITHTPSVVSVVGGIVEITTRHRFKKLWEGLNLWMINSCTVVTTKGQAVCNYLVNKGVTKDKIFILNGSIDTQKFNFNPQVDKDIDILFVGSFSSLKGPDRVLQVIRKLQYEFPDLKAALIGDGDLYPIIQQEIIRLNLQSNIKLPGYIEHPEDWFQRAKCILIPSESEGLPTCMLEAMACACVPVVSNVGNITDAAKHELNSFVVQDYTDIATFTRYAKNLLQNEPLRIELAKNAMVTIEDNYTKQKQAIIALKIIEFIQ